jgi:hypothetical protein
MLHGGGLSPNKIYHVFLGEWSEEYTNAVVNLLPAWEVIRLLKESYRWIVQQSESLISDWRGHRARNTCVEEGNGLWKHLWLRHHKRNCILLRCQQDFYKMGFDPTAHKGHHYRLPPPPPRQQVVHSAWMTSLHPVLEQSANLRGKVDCFRWLTTKRPHFRTFPICTTGSVRDCQNGPQLDVNKKCRWDLWSGTLFGNPRGESPIKNERPTVTVKFDIRFQQGTEVQ